MRAPVVLLTGSRNWTDRDKISRELFAIWDELGRHPRALLVHGACHLGGADIIGEGIWRSKYLPTLGIPALIDSNGRVYGPDRNAELIQTKPDRCLAFPTPGSRGTRNCIRLAKEAGIDTRIFEG
ncbi:hypothetical protein CJ179_38890 [Rhodococcus sp. ACS1]|nr:hypothetical protein CJ179_38890 [Rhodococcus sp. ACS1]